MIRNALCLVAIACTALVLGPASVAAAPAPPVTTDFNATTTFAVAAPVVTLLVALLIPLINGFLTKPATPAGVKAIGTIILNAVAALITTGLVEGGGAVFSSTTLYTALLGCIISIATYAGVYKPMNLTSNAGGKLAGIGRT